MSAAVLCRWMYSSISGDDRLALGLDVHHLAAHHAVGAGGVGDLGDHVAPTTAGLATRAALPAIEPEGQREQRVAGQDGHGLAEDLVVGEAARGGSRRRPWPADRRG